MGRINSHLSLAGSKLYTAEPHSQDAAIDGRRRSGCVRRGGGNERDRCRTASSRRSHLPRARHCALPQQDVAQAALDRGQTLRTLEHPPDTIVLGTVTAVTSAREASDHVVELTVSLFERTVGIDDVISASRLLIGG